MKWINREKNLVWHNTGNFRLLTLAFIFCLLGAILIERLFQLQIVRGQEYAENFELKTTRTINEAGVRGVIYDCNGYELAGNQLTFAITMTDCGEYATNREKQLTLNSVIYQVQKMAKSYGVRLNNELKICLGENDSYQYAVEGNALKRLKADIFGHSSIAQLTEWQKKMSAEELIEYLAGNNKFALYGEGETAYTTQEREKYGLPNTFSKEEALDIVSVRYMLSINAYRRYIPITIAHHIPNEVMAYVLENNDSLVGVDIAEEPMRVYQGGEAFAHIIGYTGKISEEELEKRNQSGNAYNQDSIVGKTGVEQFMEETLQGKSGEKKLVVNNIGKVLKEEEIARSAEAGQDVYLSIDWELQTAAYQILEQQIAGIVADNLINEKTFDKSAVKDASQIRIPIYDVYQALIQNNIVNINAFRLESASQLEQRIAQLIEQRKQQQAEWLTMEIFNGDRPVQDFSKEQQTYIQYCINESEYFNKSKLDKTDAIYKKWQDGAIAPKEWLQYALRQNWFDTANILEKDVYVAADELFESLARSLISKFCQSQEIEKTMFYYLLLEQKISGSDMCELLYEQKILSKEDADYDNLRQGKLDAFSFIKKKIMQLEITPNLLALDPCSGSIVIVESNSGKILACATYPGYDHNRLANNMDNAYYLKLCHDQSLPLYNRATQQLTAPGSTLKPITLAAGLKEGVIQINSSVVCDGIFDKVQPGLRCWNHAGHGEIKDAAAGLAASCNDYLCEISYRLGLIGAKTYQDNQALTYLQNYANLFHLNEKSGIELPESEPQVSQDYAISSAIGQGTHNYATVQLARYANILATNGKVFQLSLIKGTVSANGELIESPSALQDCIDLDNDIWAAIRNGMRQFAQQNKYLKELGVETAGKTGTAQESKTRPEHSLFIGYAPADAPEITIAVRIANGYGSANATQVGRDIIKYYFGLEEKPAILNGHASLSDNAHTD